MTITTWKTRAAAIALLSVFGAGVPSPARGSDLGGKCTVELWGKSSGDKVCALVAKGKYAYVQAAPPTKDATPTSTAATALSVAKTTRKSPGSIGSVQTLKDTDNGDMDILVDSFVPDATKQIAAANQFNDAAPAGKRFVMVHLSGTFHAGKKKDKATLGAAGFSVFGSTAVERTAFDCSAVLPEPIDSNRDMLDGATIAGNMCFLLPTTEASGPLTLRVTESFCFSNCDELWFRLQ